MIKYITRVDLPIQANPQGFDNLRIELNYNKDRQQNIVLSVTPIIITNEGRGFSCHLTGKFAGKSLGVSRVERYIAKNASSYFAELAAIVSERDSKAWTFVLESLAGYGLELAP